MTKSERKTFLQNRWRIIHGAPIPGLIQPSYKETCEEFASYSVRKTDDSILDEEVELNERDWRDRERVGEVVLTIEERRQIRAELNLFRQNKFLNLLFSGPLLLMA